MRREMLPDYDTQDRIGLAVSFIIIAIAILYLVLHSVTGYTVTEAEAEAPELVRRTYFIKGVLVYTEFEEGKIVMSYLESEEVIMQKFMTYLDSSYSLEDGEGLLVITPPQTASSSDEVQYYVDYITRVIDTFNEIPDSELFS